MGIFKKIISWNPFNSKTKKEIRYSSSYEELLETKGENKALKKENAHLKRKVATQEHQLADIDAKKRDKKEKIKEIDLNNEIAKKLRKDVKEIDDERYGKFFSWTKLEKKRFTNKRFRDNFIISDKDGVSSYKLGELLISTKGFFAITDQSGKLLNVSSDVRGLIHKPESIFTTFNTGRLLLAMDKDGNYIPGIDDVYEDADNIETTIPVFNYDTKEYEETKFLKKNLRSFIINLQNDVEEFKKKYAIMEQVTSDLRIQNVDLNRLNEALLFSNQKTKTSVSDALNIMRQHSMEMSDILKKSASQTERLELYEKEVVVYKELIKKLLDQIEDTGNQTAHEKAKAAYKDAVEFVKSNTTTIEKETIVEKPSKQIPQIPK